MKRNFLKSLCAVALAGMTTFSARSTKAGCANSRICALGAPGASFQSNCSSVLSAGIVASFISVVTLRSWRPRASASRTRSRKSA